MWRTMTAMLERRRVRCGHQRGRQQPRRWTSDPAQPVTKSGNTKDRSTESGQSRWWGRALLLSSTTSPSSTAPGSRHRRLSSHPIQRVHAHPGPGHTGELRPGSGRERTRDPSQVWISKRPSAPPPCPWSSLVLSSSSRPRSPRPTIDPCSRPREERHRQRQRQRSPGRVAVRESRGPCTAPITIPERRPPASPAPRQAAMPIPTSQDRMRIRRPCRQLSFRS